MVKDEKYLIDLVNNLIKHDKEDKLRACYLHACLKYVNNGYLTNTSLRERFGIEAKNNAMISRIIKNAVQENLIKDIVKIPHQDI